MKIVIETKDGTYGASFKRLKCFHTMFWFLFVVTALFAGRAVYLPAENSWYQVYTVFSAFSGVAAVIVGILVLAKN